MMLMQILLLLIMMLMTTLFFSSLWHCGSHIVATDPALQSILPTSSKSVAAKNARLMGEPHWSLTSCNHQLTSWQSWPEGKNWCGIMTQLILLQNCPNQPCYEHLCVAVSCSEVINEIGFNFHTTSSALTSVQFKMSTQFNHFAYKMWVTKYN